MLYSTIAFFKRPRVRSFLGTVIPFFFYTLLIIFLFMYLQTIDFTKLQKITFSWPLLLGASLFALGFRFWGAFIWFILLKGLGAKGIEKQKTPLLYVYAKSWLGRYIPGTAPWILGKIYFASKYGVSKNKLAVSSLLEGALQIVVIMTLGFALLIFDSRLNTLDQLYKWLLFGAVIGCIVIMIPRVFNTAISFAYKLVRRKALGKEHRARGKTIIVGASLYAFGAILNGLALFLISKAFYIDLPFNDVLFVVGTASLAGALSMLAVFAPSGLGVREGILLLLLSMVMPPEFALIVTTAMRLWDIVIDFVFFVLAAAIKRLLRK